MPTYEYQCSKCGHKWEKFQSITAAPIKVCPSCGKRTAQRLIGTGAGIIFKGSGFYQTDYRSDSYKERAKSDKESSKPAAASDSAPGNAQSAKPDSNPATTEKPGSTPAQKTQGASTLGVPAPSAPPSNPASAKRRK